MENKLKNELDRILSLMEYDNSNSKKPILIENEDISEKEKLPFRMNRIGGNKIRVQDSNTGDKIDIPQDSIDLFFEKLSSFKNI